MLRGESKIMNLQQITTISDEDIGFLILIKEGYLVKVLTTDKGGVMATNRDTNPNIIPIHNNMTGFYFDDMELVATTDKKLKVGDLVVTNEGRLATITKGKLGLGMTYKTVDKSGIYNDPACNLLLNRDDIQYLVKEV